MSNCIPRPAFLTSIVALSIWLASTLTAQSDGCKFSPDESNPTQKVLHCGSNLIVRTAPGTAYHSSDHQLTQQPQALQLDSGALMLEFHPSGSNTTFQILAPNAIAAVRGTKWVVEVAPGRTSTFVIAGAVAVSRLDATQGVVLKPGEGADVSPGAGAIVVKTWAKKRVQALLARFGE
jgi:ferric-dicitrate binding protein FerR (iron transport regulator)